MQPYCICPGFNISQHQANAYLYGNITDARSANVRVAEGEQLTLRVDVQEGEVLWRIWEAFDPQREVENGVVTVRNSPITKRIASRPFYHYYVHLHCLTGAGTCKGSAVLSAN